LLAHTACNAVIYVDRPGIESYEHLRDRLRWLAEPLHIGELGSIPLGIALIAGSSDTTAPRDLDRLLQYDGHQVSVLGRIAEDPKDSGALEGRLRRHIARSLLLLS